MLVSVNAGSRFFFAKYHKKLHFKLKFMVVLEIFGRNTIKNAKKVQNLWDFDFLIKFLL